MTERSASNRPYEAVLSRRDLLGGAAAMGLASGLGLATAGKAAAENISAKKWRALSAAMRGRVYRPVPYTYEFHRLARPNNLEYQNRRPAGIAMCRSAKDVAAAIEWCREVGIDFVIRSGGNNCAGYSTTYGLLIDVAVMTDVSFDKASGLVTIEAGARSGDVDAVLRRSGVSITRPRCPTIGMSGFLLGGGIGLDMRARGIGSDRLVATELVTADGKLIQATRREEADLFWACRGGGGGSFGVNTSFVVETFPVGNVTVFDITWETARASVLSSLVRALEKAPHTLGSVISLGAVLPKRRLNGVKPELNVTGQFVGTPSDLRDILGSVYAVAAPKAESIRQMPYWQAQDRLVEVGTPSHYRERSRFVQRKLDASACETAFEFIESWPGTEVGAWLRLFQLGGAVNEPGAAATAFPHRDSRWLASILLKWRGDGRHPLENALKWQDRFYDAMVPLCGDGAYVNFSDDSLKDWASQYYRGNLTRLSRIKEKHDPNRVFRFPQAIPQQNA